MSGTIGILNVGAGDTKLTFDKNNPAECIRAARIVKDMLRRGYALLIEVKDKKGKKTTVRVRDFREDTFEYIIADFDPIEAEKAEREELEHGESSSPETGKKKRGRPVRAVPASSVRGVAVARTAGG